ncbi:MerR family transcriptional regulator [Cetobacterium somerae]|uniref:MerR family transcriptional regulator n=1 Tax=Cetobacterium sp. NK01 TaxID=2993530 RepID=UPI002116A7E7|nr:MerR family transcriptional regulator [Cetobacterium sp. NK01]MCQ8213576.1 MerR family transcriptional regulator [Cetobacterium sp. NK01]
MFDEFFTIGEVSKSTNIPISTLRYYDKVGLLSPAFKNDDTNYRYYTPMQIITLKVISHMRHLGFSIEYIKSHFENMDYEHTLQLFEKVLLETKLEIKKLKNTEKELVESWNKFKENFQLEKKVGIPFIDETADIKGIIYNGPVHSLGELSKTLKNIDNFEISNNLTPVLRGFKVSFNNWKKNRFTKDCLIASMKENHTNKSIVIPKGKYACVYGKGTFEEQNIIENLLNWIKENGYSPKNEFYLTFTDLIMFKSKKDFLYLLRIPII